jgi:hypothetical protein
MVPKNQVAITRIVLNGSLFLAFLVSLLISPRPALAEAERTSALPDFSAFTKSVEDGNVDVIRGVYVPGVLADQVVQQPLNAVSVVSAEADVITQFSLAAQLGNVGLLAHNSLAGETFGMLVPGQSVRLVYGDGRIEYFRVSQVLRYQALDPYSPMSKFLELNSNITLTAAALFARVYRGERHVTFQTCFEQNGNSSWGRLFVIAKPDIGFADMFLPRRIAAPR